MKAVVSCTNSPLSETMLQDLEIIAQLLNDHHLEPRELDRAEKLVKELAFLVRCRKNRDWEMAQSWRPWRRRPKKTGSRRRKYRDWETDRKSTRLNSSHSRASRMPSSA